MSSNNLFSMVVLSHSINVVFYVPGSIVTIVVMSLCSLCSIYHYLKNFIAITVGLVLSAVISIVSMYHVKNISFIVSAGITRT